MNLDTVHAILRATIEQPYGFLKIVNPELERDIQEMAEAGLITATLSTGRPGSFTAVNRVTDAGMHFLRVFRPHDFSRPAPTTKVARRKVIPFVRPHGFRSVSMMGK